MYCMRSGNVRKVGKASVENGTRRDITTSEPLLLSTLSMTLAFLRAVI